MIVLRGVANLERDRGDREKRLAAEVLAGLERDAIRSLGGLLDESQAAVIVRLAVADDVESAVIVFERDLHPRGGAAFGCVEDMRRDSHQFNSFANRRCMIFRCSSAATRNSVAASFPKRSRHMRSISSADLPVAQTM